MVKIYNDKPSNLLKIDDPYTAFCLDEAIAEFIINIENKKKPRFRVEKGRNSTNSNPGLNLLLGK